MIVMSYKRPYCLATAALLAVFCCEQSSSFSARLSRRQFGIGHRTRSSTSSPTLLQSSYVGEGSEYSSSKSDFDDDDDKGSGFERGFRDEDEDETPTVELKPVPLSKNAGNRFVAIVWDRELDTQNRDALDLHHERVPLTEDHVMYCRKTNLYNETFNADSMADILWSLPILSSDLKRVIGHAMCLESTEIGYAKDVLSKDPIIQKITGGDITNIPFFRWRHIRDYSLRIDDGRFGFPCMCLAMDNDAGEVGELRSEVWEEMLQYLMRSESVIAAGPLHVATETKDDPASVAVGDLILFNAKDRELAIDFVENMPTAQDGLYKEMRVHFYNHLDITGKFVSEDPLRDAPCEEMKEALEYWGYPTADDQTPWLNC